MRLVNIKLSEIVNICEEPNTQTEQRKVISQELQPYVISS